MLSTEYRLRMEFICKRIADREQVKLEDMIWANKLAKANTSARGMLKTAQRISIDPTDTFSNQLNLGDPQNEKRGFSDPEDIVDWFHEERSDDWRQRD